jgi:hypothetical protein
LLSIPKAVIQAVIVVLTISHHTCVLRLRPALAGLHNQLQRMVQLLAYVDPPGGSTQIMSSGNGIQLATAAMRLFVCLSEAGSEHRCFETAVVLLASGLLQHRQTGDYDRWLGLTQVVTGLVDRALFRVASTTTQQAQALQAWHLLTKHQVCGKSLVPADAHIVLQRRQLANASTICHAHGALQLMLSTAHVHACHGMPWYTYIY